MALPPGQRVRDDFPRFGLPQYADRVPSEISSAIVSIQVNGVDLMSLDCNDSTLDPVTIERDFHCVTTWSHAGNRWTGIRFRDLFETHIQTTGLVADQRSGVVFRALDGYATSLPLVDLLNDDVLIATRLDGERLDLRHGAPARLVAPQHYGYKNLKHLKRIEVFSQLPEIKRGIRAFLDHPRARVAQEERGRWLPGWLLRYVYRPFIPRTVATFERALKDAGTADDP